MVNSIKPEPSRLDTNSNHLAQTHDIESHCSTPVYKLRFELVECFGEPYLKMCGGANFTMDC